MKRPRFALAALLTGLALASCAPVASLTPPALTDPFGGTLAACGAYTSQTPPPATDNAGGSLAVLMTAAYQVVQFRAGATEVGPLCVALFGSGLAVNSPNCRPFAGALECRFDNVPARHSLIIPARGVTSVRAFFTRGNIITTLTARP